MTMFLLFGPFLMCFQTYKLYQWLDQQKKKDASKSVEDDPDFEEDPDAPDAAFEENKENQNEEKKDEDEDDAPVPVAQETAPSEESKASGKPKTD